MGNKKDNFWEMGDTGPCGPCSEVHVDCRTDAERNSIDGKALVNADHPQVIEIWNNVFMQFNRLKDGSLEPLPAQHVDTGMGFERLVRVIQGKTSNYDTDVFTGTIAEVEKITGKKYDYSDSKQAVAFRVLADHIRAIGFTIADGQLPAATGAGYVIRRILRRAVRYYYTYLDFKQPLLHQLMPLLAAQFEHVFPELHTQVDFVSKVVKEEEDSFLKTIENGLARIDRNFKSELESAVRIQRFLQANSVIVALEWLHPDKNSNRMRLDIYLPEYNIGFEVHRGKQDGVVASQISRYKEVFGCEVYDVDVEKLNNGMVTRSYFENILKRQLPNGNLLEIEGRIAFELNDTYGFPVDLTNLIAKELGGTVDMVGFEAELQKQKHAHALQQRLIRKTG
jgi:alanyl-tRNA synthetase